MKNISRGTRYLTIAFSVFLLTFFGCSQSNPSGTQSSQEEAQAEAAPVESVAMTEASSRPESLKSQFTPFFVYEDKGSRGNHYTPSGFMPNGKCLRFIDTWMDGCYEGSSCIKIVYDVDCSREDQSWAGIYWMNPPNNWGSRKGGYNLNGATKLTFWAKGAHGGEQIEEFKIGGITGDYPDSDMALIGPVILTDEWRQYTIDLRGKDLSYISGGFTWSTNVDVNPQDCTFYLDNIRYE